eukprot:4625641-Alexandrium_andersonii.AAC.1
MHPSSPRLRYCSLHKCSAVKRLAGAPDNDLTMQWLLDGLALPAGAAGQAARKRNFPRPLGAA